MRIFLFKKLDFLTKSVTESNNLEVINSLKILQDKIGKTIRISRIDLIEYVDLLEKRKEEFQQQNKQKKTFQTQRDEPKVSKKTKPKREADSPASSLQNVLPITIKAPTKTTQTVTLHSAANETPIESSLEELFAQKKYNALLDKFEKELNDSTAVPDANKLKLVVQSLYKMVR